MFYFDYLFFYAFFTKECFVKKSFVILRETPDDAILIFNSRSNFLIESYSFFNMNELPWLFCV